jgi:preprotein translocase subunit SecE
MAKIIKFINEVKVEAARVVWPSRNETVTAALVVFGAVVVSSLVFLLIDTVSYRLVQLLLAIGN